MQRLSTKCLLGVIFFLLVSSVSYSQDYYWVGGSGSWTELSHWATSSGGTTKHTVLPGSGNDVFFDANSFSATGQVVSITDGATCRSMNWTGVTNSPTIASFIGDIVNIHGSFILPATVIRNFPGELHFKATTTGHTIDLGGLPLRSPVNEEIYFEGVGGSWTLQSSLEIYLLNITGGTLNTNGQAVTASILRSNGSSARALNLGASNLTVDHWDIISATGLTINAGTSTITTDFQFKGAGLTYNNLIVSGTVSMIGSNTFNSLTIQPSTTLRLTSGTNQTLTSLVSLGTTANPITIEALTAGIAATITKAGGGTVSIANVRLRDNTAMPSGTFSATNAADLGNNTNWDITPIEPTSQVSGLTVSKRLKDAVMLSWTSGNGTKRLIIAKASSAVTTPPTDNTAYTAAAFESGTLIGPNEYVVYNGTGNSALITGLSANTIYHFRAFELNAGTGTKIDYLTTIPASAAVSTTTLPSTAVIISNSPVSQCSGTYYSSGGIGNYSNSESFTQTLSSSSAGQKVRLTFTDFSTASAADNLKIYDGANTSAPLIGTYSGSASPGIVTATNASGQLTIQWTSDAFTTSTGWAATMSCVTLDTEPTVSTTSLNFSNVTGSSLTVNFTKGNGSKRIVVAHPGTAVSFTPTDGTDYTANSSFGSGTSLSGNFVVYNGTGASAAITNLAVNTTYHFAVYEYNGANTSANYKTTLPGINSTTTTSVASEPTVAASAFTATGFSETQVNLAWTNGNGARRIVVAKQGSAVNASPTDGSVYTAGWPTGSDLGSGNIVIYNGTGNSASLTGLTANTTYHFQIFEFNGTAAGSTNYLTSGSATASGSTLVAPPTVGPSSVSVTKIGINTAKISWTNGSGENRLVLMHLLGNTYTINDGREYNASSVFGEGDNAGPSSYAIYKGSGNSVVVTGLQPDTYYSYSIIEYNGTGGSTNYASSAFNSTFQTRRYKPTVQSSNLIASNTTSSSVQLTWQRGNGTSSVVVGRKVNAPTYPKDSTVISTSDEITFGSNTVINGNTIVLYQGTKNSITVAGLEPSTTYQFSVFEVNSYFESQQVTFFLTTSAPAVSVQTLQGKDFYWVGGKGKWSQLEHWATTSGGSTKHTALPGSADNVFFDANSFAADGDTVWIDPAIIYSRNIDWTGVTEKVNFYSTIVNGNDCNHKLICSGSLKYVENVNVNLRSYDFISNSPGQVVDFAGKSRTSRSCQNNYKFSGFGGEWNIVGKEFYMGDLYVLEGRVTFNNAVISGWYFDFGLGAGNSVLDLGNSKITLYSLGNGQNGKILGGTINFSYNSSSLSLNGSSIRKVRMQANSDAVLDIKGGGSIDSLDVASGTTLILESSKTYNIKNFIFKGDTLRSSFLRASTTGVPATIVKESGTATIDYVFVTDSRATGGATFNATNSIDLGNNSGWNFTSPVLYAPKRPSYGARFEKFFHTTGKINWVKGDGTDRILIMKEGSPVSRSPMDGMIYSANAAFGQGADLGDGNFVVYNGKVDSALVNSLTPGKLYYFQIIEYNYWNSKTKYLSTPPVTFSIRTLKANDIVNGNGTVSACGVTFFDSGGRGNYKTMQTVTQTIYPEASAQPTKLGALFTQFDILAFDTLYVYDGTSTSAPLLYKLHPNAKPGSSPIMATNPAGALTFKFVARSVTSALVYNGWEAELFCAGTPASEPTTQTTSMKSIQKTATTIKLELTKGNGAKRVIVARQNTATTRTPIDGADLKADAEFGAGASLGDDNYIVYSGTENTVEVTGLSSNSIYHFSAFEYNGDGPTVNYLTTNPATAKDTTKFLAPTYPAYNLSSKRESTILTFYMWAGNGTGRLGVISKNPITFLPVDATEYAVGTTLPDQSTVISAGSGTMATAMNLQQETLYYVKFFEYNGDGAKRLYLTSKVAAAKVSTTGPLITLTPLSVTTYCAESPFTLFLNTKGTFKAGNSFKVEMSDETGKFTNPVVLIDTVMKDSQTPFPTIKVRLPGNLPDSAFRNFRVRATAHNVHSDSIRILIKTITAPTFTEADSVFTTSLTESIQWRRNGIDIFDATTPTYKYKLGGVYTLKYSANGCSRISEPFVVTGLEDNLFDQAVKLYPNPASTYIVIEKLWSESMHYEIFNTNGVRVISDFMDDRSHTVNSESLAPGLYHIRFTIGKQKFSRSIIKE